MDFVESQVKAVRSAPLWGLAGENMINVLEINLELQQKFHFP